MKSFFSLLALVLGSRWSESTVLLQKNEKRAEWNDVGAAVDPKMTLGFEREWWVSVNKGGTRIEFDSKQDDHTTLWETDLIRFDFELQAKSASKYGAPEAITKDYGFDIGSEAGQTNCNTALADMFQIMEEMVREQCSTKFERVCAHGNSKKCPSRSISTTLKALKQVTTTGKGDEAVFVFPYCRTTRTADKFQLSPQVTVTLSLPTLEHLWSKGWPMEAYNPAHPKVQAAWRTAVMKDTAKDAKDKVEALGRGVNGWMQTAEADFLKGFMVNMVMYAKTAALKYNSGEYWSASAKQWFYIHSKGEQWTKDNYGVLPKTPPAHLFNELPDHSHDADYYADAERKGSLRAEDVDDLKKDLYAIVVNDIAAAYGAAGREKKIRQGSTQEIWRYGNEH